MSTDLYMDAEFTEQWKKEWDETVTELKRRHSKKLSEITFKPPKSVIENDKNNKILLTNWDTICNKLKTSGVDLSKIPITSDGTDAVSRKKRRYTKRMAMTV